MAMGKRAQGKQGGFFVATSALVKSPGHPFYEKLTEVLSAEGFDAFAEARSAPYYAKKLGRPSIPPGVYFRMLMIGYYEGLESERGIDWRVSDSLSLRRFLGYGLDEETPDHSSLSRTRHRLPTEIHTEIFNWALRVLGKADLVKGKTVGVDATTLEANAAMRSIVLKTQERPIRPFWSVLPRPRARRRQHGRTWRSWTRSGRRRPRTRTGSIRTIRTPGSPR